MSHFRIYIDESGTHSDAWLVIGMLFVPDHGPLHSDLCRVKDAYGYLNKSPKRTCVYKESHFTKFSSQRDVDVAKEWIDVFVRNSCYYRCVVIDWSIWKSKYFGKAFESEALCKRRAYKKWAEMLLHPELKSPTDGREIRNARMYLDRLRVIHGYDVMVELQSRFTNNYQGSSPYIQSFQHAESWKDGNQCLQLCDILTACMFQNLVPSTAKEKVETREYLTNALEPFGVKGMKPSFWKGYHPTTLTKHFPKYSAWFWQPSDR